MIGILIIVICTLLNGLLSAYEMAFVTISKFELKKLSAEGNVVASKILPYREKPERTLSIIQIGITLLGVISAAVGGASASENLEPFFSKFFGEESKLVDIVSICVVVIPITYITVVLGELVPKSLALRKPIPIINYGSRLIILADKILSPLVTNLEIVTKFTLRLLSKSSSNTEQTLTEDDTIHIQNFSNQHKQYLINMAFLEKRKVSEIFEPWSQVIFVYEHDDFETVIRTIFDAKHTRFPVLTHQDEVIGIIHSKEILAARESGVSDWLSVVRPAIFVNSSDTALHTFAMLQERKSHLAIVDKNKGIITLEDITEEIFGEIYDEHEDGMAKKIISSRFKNQKIF